MLGAVRLADYQHNFRAGVSIERDAALKPARSIASEGTHSSTEQSAIIASPVGSQVEGLQQPALKRIAAPGGDHLELIMQR